MCQTRLNLQSLTIDIVNCKVRPRSSWTSQNESNCFGNSRYRQCHTRVRYTQTVVGNGMYSWQQMSLLDLLTQNIFSWPLQCLFILLPLNSGNLVRYSKPVFLPIVPLLVCCRRLFAFFTTSSIHFEWILTYLVSPANTFEDSII